MVCNSWHLRSFLVVVLGLISHSVFAQSGKVWDYESQAHSACAAARSSWLAAGGSNTPCIVPANVCSHNASSKFFALSTGRTFTSGCLFVSDPQSYWPGQSIRWTNLNISFGYFTFSYTNSGSEPEPECPGPSAPEFNGLKAPTANGTGDVCIEGCAASIALQAPPLPLFSGQWTGQTCVATPSNTPVPAGDPNDDPCSPGDSDCPGTGDPSDPEAPPGTGGGGIQCDTPPVCNSDGVTCSMLYQQWRGRCEAEYARIEQRDRLDRIGDSLDNGFADLSDGLGSLGDKVDAVGDKVDAVGTKVDAVGDKVDAVGDKVGEVNQSVKDLHADLETGFSTGGIGDPGDAAWGSVSSSTEIGVGDLDASGMGFPRVCPVFQNVNLNFGSISVTLPFADFDMHCSLLEWLGYIIVAFSAFWAARVLLDV